MTNSVLSSVLAVFCRVVQIIRPAVRIFAVIMPLLFVNSSRFLLLMLNNKTKYDIILPNSSSAGVNRRECICFS